MAQFRAVIEGNRGPTSRLGSKQSGMTAHVDGWYSGVTVKASHIDGQDVFTIYATGGSNGAIGWRTVANLVDGKVTIMESPGVGA